MAKRWEHRVERIHGSELRQDRSTLSYLGKEGWELVGTMSYDILIFKRPMPRKSLGEWWEENKLDITWHLYRKWRYKVRRLQGKEI